MRPGARICDSFAKSGTSDGASWGGGSLSFRFEKQGFDLIAG